MTTTLPAWLRRTLIALLSLLAIWTLWPFAIVPAGHRGVMATLGKPSDAVYDEGIHPRLPIVQTLYLMDVRVARSEGEGDAASKDLQAVRVKFILNYHLDRRQFRSSRGLRRPPKRWRRASSIRHGPKPSRR
jgi:regulator of protease activity HflC (stomatin/prohibitin superfamily)